MKRFTFFLNIEGLGDTSQEAWDDAIGRLFESAKEYLKPPETIYTGDEPIPAAEILNGPPYQEFGIDHGPEDFGEQRAADLDEWARNRAQDPEE